MVKKQKPALNASMHSLIYQATKSANTNTNLNITKSGIPIESSIDLQINNNSKDYDTTVYNNEILASN